MHNFILNWRHHHERSKLEKGNLAPSTGVSCGLDSKASPTAPPHLQTGQLGALQIRSPQLGLLLLIQQEAKNRNPKKVV